MKKITLIICGILLICGCTKTKTQTDYDSCSVSESNTYQTPNTTDDIVDAFFKDFQEQNEDWFKTEEGHKKLIDTFKTKMTSNIEFAKACASYQMQYEFQNPIVISESLGKYENENNEEGELKVFMFRIEVPLKKPLYNGQKTVDVYYEITSGIPSTIEDHWKPYVNDIDTCMNTKTPFFNYCRDFCLGSFMIGKRKQ